MTYHQNKLAESIPDEVLEFAHNKYDYAVDESIAPALLRAMYYIKNFCNIKSIPEELYFTWVDIAGYYVKVKPEINRNDMPNVNLPSFGDSLPITQENALNSIQSIQMGDTSITFKNSQEIAQAFNPREEYEKYKTEDEFLKSFHTILYNFRVLKW